MAGLRVVRAQRGGVAANLVSARSLRAVDNSDEKAASHVAAGLAKGSVDRTNPPETVAVATADSNSNNARVGVEKTMVTAAPQVKSRTEEILVACHNCTHVHRSPKLR